MLYPKFPQRYLAAIVVCLILTLGFLGALFLIYLFNEGGSPLIPHNGSTVAGTNAGVVSVKPALSAQPLQQQLHEMRQPLKKRIYLQQPVAMLNANEDDDDEVMGGGDGGEAGGVLGDAVDREGDASARFQSPYGSENDYVEDEDMLNIDNDISERRQQHLSMQQHFVDDNYQLQHMLGAVVDDNAEQPPTQPKQEQLLPKQRPTMVLDAMLHDALVAGVGSAELSVDDNEDEDDDLGDDYDISISAELWHQRKQPQRKQAQRLDALDLDVQRRDNNYDTIYIDDLERAPATPSGGGGLQRPHDALVNLEIADINYFDAIIDGGERDDKGATVGGVAAAAVPARAATKSGSQSLQQQMLQKQQRRKNRQQPKNRQQQPQQNQQQKLLSGRYSELTVARRVLPLYYLNMLYNKHRQHNNKERRPVSVDDEGGDDEDIDADGDIEEAYLVGSGSGAGVLASDRYTEIEDDIDAAETAELINRINSKMRQATKKGGSYGNSNNNRDLGKNCNNSYSNDANKNNAAGNNNNSNYKERKHRKQMLAKHVSCNINKSTTTAAAAEASGGSVKHYAYELRNGSSNNNSSRSSAVIDFYNFSSELVSNLSAPQLYQDEKFVSSMRTAAAAATGATTMATPSTAATAAANSGTVTKKSITAVTAPLALRAVAATGIENSNNNKVWPPGTSDTPTVAFVTETTTTASSWLTSPKIAEPQQSLAINVAAAKLPEVTSTGGDNMSSGGTLFNSAAWLETRTRRIIGNVKKSEERSRQLLLCEEAGGGELCRMLFKSHLNE